MNFTMLASLQWKPFDRHDWDAYAGCKTKNPMIAEHGDHIYITDGPELAIINSETGDQQTFVIK